MRRAPAPRSGRGDSRQQALLSEDVVGVVTRDHTHSWYVWGTDAWKRSRESGWADRLELGWARLRMPDEARPRTCFSR